MTKRKNRKKKKEERVLNSKIVVNKEKHEEQKKLLEEIYAMDLDDLDTGDLSKFYYKKHSWWKTVLKYVFFLVFLLLSAWALNFYINSKPAFDGKKVFLTVKVDKNIKLAKQVKLLFTINNIENVNLENVKLTINYPYNFYLLKSNIPVTDPDWKVWQIGEIPAQTIKTIELDGYFLANFGDLDNNYSKLTSKLYYNAENFHSLFTVKDEEKLMFQKANVNLDIFEKDKKVILTYKNLENYCLKNIVLKMNIPDFLDIKNSSLEINKKVPYETFNEYFWNIGSLDPGAEAKLELDLVNLDKDSEGNNKLYAELFIKDLKNENSKYILTSAEYIYNSLNSGLDYQLKINDLATAKQSLGDEREVVYTITYTNNTGKTLYDVNLDLFVDDFVSKEPLQHILNWNTAYDEFDGTITRTENGAKVNWDYHNIENLKEFKNGDSVKISLKIDRYNSKLANIENWRDFFIKNYLVITYKLSQDDDKQESLKSDILEYNFQKYLNLEVDKVDRLGSSVEENKLYNIAFELKPLIDKEDFQPYNIKVLFDPKNDLALLNPDDLDLVIEKDPDVEMYKNEEDKIVVKIKNLKDKNIFHLLLKSKESCEDANVLTCLFKEIYLEYWNKDNKYTDYIK